MAENLETGYILELTYDELIRMQIMLQAFLDRGASSDGTVESLLTKVMELI